MRVDGRFVRGQAASQIAPRVLGPAGTIVELSFKRVHGPAVCTVNVALLREPPRDQTSQHHASQAHGASDVSSRRGASQGLTGRTVEATSSSERPFTYKGSTHTDWRTDEVLNPPSWRLSGAGRRQEAMDAAHARASEDNRLHTPPKGTGCGGGAAGGREGGMGKRWEDAMLSPDVHDVHRTLMELSLVSSKSPRLAVRPSTSAQHGGHTTSPHARAKNQIEVSCRWACG